MALSWKWDNKIGEITLEQTRGGDDKQKFSLSLYEGNAYLIMLAETDETYNMFSFWLDKQHAKNCLGLNKREGKTENIYDTGFQTFTRVKLNRAKITAAKTRELCGLFAEAFKNITIEIYTEG